MKTSSTSRSGRRSNKHIPVVSRRQISAAGPPPRWLERGARSAPMAAFALSLTALVSAAHAQDAPSWVLPAASDQHDISQTFPPPVHLFGDWGGLRPWLQNDGIAYDFDYTTESVANLSGGRKTGADYAHQIGLSIDVDWQKFAAQTCSDSFVVS